ncbi:nibrin isoform X1 [Oryzias melastigma]|uniref:Nibrin n=2 Tax=Oryzias melastigma TaxID=30732 RepID=A0A3B3BHP5_ORYME|nr:nibrin isoform X1 [Oryzias melastigma]
MWILSPLQNGGETHYLLCGREYVVGRKNCDILLPSDQSISRAHAHLTATDQTLTLTDSSKYGTFVRDERVTSPVTLMSGDEVTFGVFHSKFRVIEQKLVVCSSCLDNDGKASLTRALGGLGGRLVNSWSLDCTHLAMPTVKVTIKTISALLCCCPIVKPEFFSELYNAVQQKRPPPKPESFTPEIDEPVLSDAKVNLGAVSARKELFNGKTFIFLSAKQLKRLSGAVRFGGGSSQLLEEGALPYNLLQSKNTCVVDVLTASSQSLLPASITEWANSVKDVLARKGLRVIPESEIGLAAIYASCDQYCNPSCPVPDSDSAPKVTPRIPSASLSQSVTVDETVLPAASQNITAYAVNTEPSQRKEVCEITGVGVAVEETQEKKEVQNSRYFSKSKLSAHTAIPQFVVPETMPSTFNNTDSLKKNRHSKAKGEDHADVRPQPSASRTSAGTRSVLHKQSPQKPKTSPQTSPQKQMTLTNFFQSVNKKRSLEDEPSAVTSEPKRAATETSTAEQAQNASLPLRAPKALPQTPALLDVHSKKPQSRKRKELEIELEELESIMSEDMDLFDGEISTSQDQQEEPKAKTSAKQKENLQDGNPSSKRQRIHLEKNGMNSPDIYSEQNNVSKTSKLLQLPDFPSEHQESEKPPETSQSSTTEEMKQLEEGEGSFVEDAELLEIDICQPEKETPAKKPVAIKQEVEESKIDEDLPKKLLLVEFRSLMVSTSPKIKPKPTQQNSHAKNFKCFRKRQTPGVGSTPIIGGSDLLVHNRGKNTDLDEWLRDAVEEEHQNQQDEWMGDDLFRYNPTKLSRRR